MKIENLGSQQRLAVDADERVVHLQNKKTSPRDRKVEGVVLHYTAVRVGSRPSQQLDKFKNLLAAEYDTVAGFVGRAGQIPGALVLSLTNASNIAREASWDFTVGRDGLIVQCNLALSDRCTWHAGRALAGPTGYIARHGSRNVFDYRNALVYDGAIRTFAGPRLPSGQIMQSGNPPTIGIELECWGRLEKHGEQIGRFDKHIFRPIPGLKADDLQVIDGKLYEPITDAQYAKLVSLCRALRDFYAISENAWFGHREIAPDNRADPDPPLQIKRLVADIFADRVQVVAVSEEDDAEDIFIGETLPDNNATA